MLLVGRRLSPNTLVYGLGAVAREIIFSSSAEQILRARVAPQADEVVVGGSVAVQGRIVKRSETGCPMRGLRIHAMLDQPFNQLVVTERRSKHEGSSVIG